MQNPLTPARVLAQFIISTFWSLLLIAPFIAPNVYAASDTFPEPEIEQALNQQLNPAFELQNWSSSLIKQTKKGPLVVDQLSLTISVKLKEPLYVNADRQQDGKMVIRVSKEKGDIIDLQGTAVVAEAPGMGIKQVQVILGPQPQGEAGLQLSRFPAGYVITEDEAGAAPAPAQTKSVVANDIKKPDTPGLIQRILTEFGAQGEIWGREEYGAYLGTPVVLRDLKQANAQTLEGVIDRPYQGLSNPFALIGAGANWTLQIKSANPSSKGTQQTMYSLALEDSQLVARRGPVIPLALSKSEVLRDRFERERAPWKFDGDISDYAQLGNMLINVNTLELVSDGWGNRPLAQVKNLPGRFWPMDSNYELTVLPYGAYRASVVRTEDPKRVSLNPMAGAAAQTWVAADLSRYVSLKEGDLWGGTIDWQGNTTSTPKNLTNIGLLNDLKPITWCGKHFYFFSQQATEKPILRIDTENGDLLEMSKTKTLDPSAMGSPDGCHLFMSDGGRMIHSAAGGKSELHVLDLLDNRSFSLDATIDRRIYVGTMKTEPQPVAVRTQSWPDRNVFLAGWAFGWYDLGNGNRALPSQFPKLVTDLPYTINVSKSEANLIPGGRYIDITYQGWQQPPDGQKKSLRKRYRFDRLQGSALPLPIEGTQHDNMGIVWVDENRYVYPRRKGSLSEVGTWLYDVQNGKHKRLSRFFSDEKIHAENRTFTSEAQARWATPLYLTGGYLALPDKNRILFSSTRGKLQELVSVSLDGEELARKPVPVSKKAQGAMRLRRLHPYEISLPFVQRSLSTD